MMSPRFDELRFAFMLLSRLPVGGIRGAAPSIAGSCWAWPLVGLAVGIIGAVAYGSGAWAGLPPIMAAVLALAATALATGAMHEDGLADLADGLGGGRGRARKLEIMRDSRIGTYGVMALILATGLRLAGLATLAEAQTATLALTGVAAASRAVLPMAVLMMPAARTDGLGHSAAGRGPVPALLAAVIGFLALLPLGLGTAIFAAFAMALVALVLAGLAMRQIGGQTGDVLGAMQQLAECAGWIVLVVTF